MDRAVMLSRVFILLGIGMLALGGWWAARSFWLERRGAVAQGTVVELVRSSDSEVGVSYAPRVRFRTASGAERLLLSDVGTGWKRYRPGDSVEVLYDPEDPEHARIRSFLELWSGSAFALAMGLLFTAAGRAFLRAKARADAAAAGHGRPGEPLGY